MPDRWYIGVIVSSGVIVGAFLYAGGWHELRHQLWMRRRNKERRGYLL